MVLLRFELRSAATECVFSYHDTLNGLGPVLMKYGAFMGLSLVEKIGTGNHTENVQMLCGRCHRRWGTWWSVYKPTVRGET